MSTFTDKDFKHSALKQIFKLSQLKLFTISLCFLLLVLILESCATHYKHRKIKQVPCPCESQQNR